ncbi:MAG: hypothetical protein MJ131_01985 [Lachnospiraceae bacterium]|nr:hypothetical protein [Lachnospiraceae bacterium]
MWNNLTVNGFQFESSKDYAEAKKEAEALNYLASRMDISNPEVAIKVYYKLLDRQNLHTIIGYTFLKQLRDFCISSGLVKDSQIKAIVMPSENTKGKIAAYGDEISLEIDASIDDTHKDVDSGFDDYDSSEAKTLADKEKKLKKEMQEFANKEKKLNLVADHYRNKSRKLVCAVVALVLIIIALFSISIYRGTLPYADIESEIQDKYAGWAEELSIREAELEKQEALMSD